jgi:hypothetical protein
MTRERIFRSTRTVRGLVLYSYPAQAIILLPSRRSATCIIAMSVEPRKLGDPVYRAFRPASGSPGGIGTSASAAGTGLRPVIMRIPAAGAGSSLDEQCKDEFKAWSDETAKLRDDLFVVLEPLDPREPAYVFHDLARAQALFPRATPYFGQRPFGRQINRAFLVGMPLPAARGPVDVAYAAVRSARPPTSPSPLLL